MPEIRDYFICPDCVVDEHLKDYINSHSSNQNQCEICLEQKAVALVNDDYTLKKFCQFLIRYHYPEYEYNTHFGGDRLEEIVTKGNCIISNKIKDYNTREVGFEEFLFELFDLDAPLYDDLFYGHMDNLRGCHMEALKDEYSAFWRKLRFELTKKNYFLLEEGALRELLPILQERTDYVQANDILIRARIGYDAIKEGFFSTQKIRLPYKDSKISAPPILSSKPGRANRHGLSYLYLSSNEETAIGEVRPHPGQFVSVGTFKNKATLKIADLRRISPLNYFNNDKQLEVFKVLNDLSRELSTPIPPENTVNYLATQFITDLIRKMGFDGISFQSSLSTGFNLVIFNPEDFEFVQDSSRLFKVQTVNYKCDQIQIPKGPYFKERSHGNEIK